MNVYYRYLDSAIGKLLLTSDGSALTGLYMEDHKYGPTPGSSGVAPAAELCSPMGWVEDTGAIPFPETVKQLDLYFSKRLTAFDLPIKFVGTHFQKMVWQQLCDIQYGTVISYAELARRIGSPKAYRAVGLANGKNSISIIVPCHRVIGVNGSLTGYGGGLNRKSALLQLEKSG
jgi:methylated-DNA-[protein]-cysteine S-methyltransferase